MTTHSRVRSEPSSDVLSQFGDALDRGEPLPADNLTQEELALLTVNAGRTDSQRPLISRLAMMIHDRREDLRQAFPFPLGADRIAFATWLVTSGRREYQLPPALIQPVMRTLPLGSRIRAAVAWRRQQRDRLGTLSVREGHGPTLGLNVVGWVSAPTGVGEACRGTLAALTKAGVPHVIWDLENISHPEHMHGVTLYHANADMTPLVTAARLARTATEPYRIGYWFWELAHFPLALAPAFRCLDEVWAPTRFCETAFRALSTIRIRWMPPAVVPPVVDRGGLGRAAFGIEAHEFLLFHAFDVRSVPERKNPLGLIEAFAHACAHSSRRLRLLLKINHAEENSTWVAAIEQAARGLPVTLLTRPLTRAEVSSVMNACDAYLSLHRSEGLGLPLIEAMYLGKPVIATGYGGVTDFLSDDTGWVVRHTMVELDRPFGPYPEGAVWAAPDAEHAGDLICQVASQPDRARERAVRALETVQALYLPEVFAQRVSQEMTRIGARASVPGKR